MVENVVTAISAREAVATANEWLVTYVGDRFSAGTPLLDGQSDTWRVPIQYICPNEGPLANVGEISVNSVSGELSCHPTIEEIKQRALAAYQTRHSENPTILPTRD